MTVRLDGLQTRTDDLVALAAEAFIYADGQPVGFVLTFEEPSEGYFLWRFMIVGRLQRRGIDRRAMQEVLEHWRELGVTAAKTSVERTTSASVTRREIAIGRPRSVPDGLTACSARTTYTWWSAPEMARRPMPGPPRTVVRMARTS